MLVFADLHHFDLFQSLQLLFEKRLGWELYRPIGMEWYHEGYWNVYPHPDTAKQYLGYECASNEYKDIHGNPLPDSAIVNKFFRIEDGIFYVLYPTTDLVQRAITLDQFKKMRFDLLISSMPEHVGIFNRLKQFQPQAKHIFQVGNNWIFKPNVDGILCSAKAFRKNDASHYVYYHQEFRIEPSVPCPNPKSAANLMHCLPKEETQLILDLEKKMPDWTWHIYGTPNRDQSTEVYPVTHEHGFIFHVKRQGDGFGYNTHRSIALGRPLITNTSHFQGMTIENLLIDGETCLNIDGLAQNQIIERLNNMAANHEYHRKECIKRFHEVVNWDQEEITIKQFLENVINK